MKRIKPSTNPAQWPHRAVETIEARKRDLIIRIADWRRDKDCSGYDVECYIGGVYDYNESEHFEKKADAIAFAQVQIAKLL